MSSKLFAGRRVLVLEDEPIIAMLAEQLLEDAGGFPECFSTLASAEAAIAAAPPHMAILDINIHGDTSYAVARLLAEMKVPTIFASGYGQAAHPPEFVAAPTVSKPYDIDEIAAAMQRAIDLV